MLYRYVYEHPFQCGVVDVVLLDDVAAAADIVAADVVAVAVGGGVVEEVEE